MGKAGLETRKIVLKNSRHLRWNYEESPDSSVGDDPMLRYHFVVVNDKNREGIMNSLAEQLSFTGPIVSIRKKEGKVRWSKFRYLFRSYDSTTAPRELDFRKVVKSFKRDYDLKEKLKGNIEYYVERIYS